MSNTTLPHLPEIENQSTFKKNSNVSLEPKKILVFLFFKALKLRQDLLNMGFFCKSTIVTFGAQRVNSKFYASFELIIPEKSQLSQGYAVTTGYLDQKSFPFQP